MKDLLALVATGYEDTELITTINILSRNNISYDLVSVENKTRVRGQNEAYVDTKPINEVDLQTYRSLFLPGGKGHLVLLENKQVLELVRHYANKLLFAICAAPVVLLAAGVIKEPFTAYPGFAKDPLNTGSAIEVQPHMITGRDFEVTIPFAKAIVTKLQ